MTDAGSLLGSVVSFAAAIVTAGLLNPVLAPVVLLAAVPNGWASVLAAKLDYESLVRMISHRRRLGVTSDLITGRAEAAEVRAFTTQDTLLGEHRRIVSQLTAEAVRVEHRKTVIRLVGRGLAGVGAALAYGVLGLLIYSGAMPLALAGAAAVAMRTASTATSTTVFAANRLYEHSFYLDLVTRCLAHARGYHRATAGLRLPRDPQLIEVQEVSFTYPGKDEPALNGVSVTIRRGQVVALVGENGSGKSTLAKVITGLYLPARRLVSWDGVDIAQVDQRELHSQVAVVLQNPAQWPMTAENNVRIGRLERPDPGGDALTAAAADAGADAVVAELPQGWDSVLSWEFQNGCDLSGGQWQRISVARGLYRDAPLLIADEPTAAMDARAEHAVFQSLHSLSRAGTAPSNGESPGATRTTVLITHRETPGYPMYDEFWHGQEAVGCRRTPGTTPPPPAASRPRPSAAHLAPAPQPPRTCAPPCSLPPDWADSSYCEGPAYQWIKISTTSITLMVLLATVARLAARQRGARLRLLRTRHAHPHPRGNYVTVPVESRDRRPLTPENSMIADTRRARSELATVAPQDIITDQRL